MAEVLTEDEINQLLTAINNTKDVVITVYGHDKIVDTFKINIFDSDAMIYCDTINNLKLDGNSWVSAKIIALNTQYAPASFLPFKFDIILKLDDRAVQKLLREVSYRELAMALKDEREAIREKIFCNISKRAAAMVKEEMEYMGTIRRIDANRCRDKIIHIIHCLEKAGEIVISYSEGDIIA